MKLIRYRKPSLKSVLGITKAKKRAKKAVGITAAMKPFRAPKNLERKIKRKVGYYSEPAKIIRNGLPTPMGIKEGGNKKGKGGKLLTFPEIPTYPALWSLLFGGFYFAKHDAWLHAFLSFILVIPTKGISWLVYPFFAEKIVRNSLLKSKSKP